MPKRQLELCFGQGEKLWRAIKSDTINRADKTTLRGDKLRLQLSVNRERFCSNGIESAVSAQQSSLGFNGVAESSAQSVRGQYTDNIHGVCVDEPMEENHAHALVALFSDYSGPLEDLEINAARAELGARFRVVKQPTKK